MPGLSESVARQRLEAEGPNELPTEKPRHFFVLLGEVIFEPMVSLLVGCGAVYLILGDRQEAIMLLGFLGLILWITLYQERKTEAALTALKNLSAPRATVLREARLKKIPGREVVRDDLLLLNEGDRVPADAKVLSASGLRVDESLLTGESVPVEKIVLSSVFAGTTVVRGQGTAQVFAVGLKTEIGKIGKILKTAQPEATRLQLETRRWVRILAIIAVGLCFLVVAVYGVTRHDWLGGLLSGLTLAMAILPNELPAVLMIFLALGAWRISLRHVLTRKMPAIENLGSATVLCVDKTGTLTMNQMSVRLLFAPSTAHAKQGTEFDLGAQPQADLPEAFHALVEFGVLASRPAPFDPMEKAVHRVGEAYLARTEHLHPDWKIAREYPLTPEMLAVSHVWKGEAQDDYIIGAKGAPEAILDLCHLDQNQVAEISGKIEEFARRGLRILGVASATFSSPTLPETPHDYAFRFLGLLGLADPVRPGVPAAISECYQAGVRVIMMTGDHAQTAGSIAREIGLYNPDEIITGPELAEMDDVRLALHLKTVNCFARMVPAQKLRLVQALKRDGEVVAMTGDGVNDAPALKTAQIGIAMGGRGTDVAREAAALVLLDDDFSSIVEAIRTGRRTFDNLRGAMAYLLAIHVPIAGMSILPVLLKLPLVLLPVHIAFLHLIIEPACSVVFEAEPPAGNSMKKAPRPPGEVLFSKKLIIPALVQGLVVFGIVLSVFLISLYRGQGERDARALTFTTLIFANLGLILVNRSWSRTIIEGFRAPNRALAWVLFGGLLVLGFVLYVPFARDLFRFSVLHPVDLGLCVGAGGVSIAWFEGWKIWRRKDLLRP
ncbi:cation-translocating P-type ATPase [Bdellovibrionota bacterium FG-1]